MTNDPNKPEPAIFVDQSEGYEPGSLTFFAVLAAFYGAALGILFARYKGWL